MIPLHVLLAPASRITQPAPANLDVLWVPSPSGGNMPFYDVRYLFVHTGVGTLASIDGEFLNGANQVVSHYAVGLLAAIHQYIDLQTASWANGGPNPNWRWPFGNENPNSRSVSIETEDNGAPDTCPVSDEQFNAIVALYRQKIQPVWPNIQYLVAHAVVNPQHSCPAARWLATGKFDQLGTALGLQVIK